MNARDIQPEHFSDGCVAAELGNDAIRGCHVAEGCDNRNLLSIDRNKKDANYAIALRCGNSKIAHMNAEWIREQLRTKPGKSQRGLAQALGIDPSGVNRLVSGSRQIKAHEIPKIEAYFGGQYPERGSITFDGSDLSSSSVNTPLTKNQAGEYDRTVTPLVIRDWPRDLPVLGSAACGDNGAFEMGGGTLDYVRRPPRLSHISDAYGLYISGDSMEPWKKDGQLVYVHPRLPVRVGDHVVIQLKPESAGEAASAFIKLLVRRTENELRVLQYHPRKEITFKMSLVHSIHRVMELEDLIGA